MTALRAKTWAGVAPLPVPDRPADVHSLSQALAEGLAELSPPPISEVVTEWGVRHLASLADDHVDVRATEDAARRWFRSLLFCGNYDAVLVYREADDGAAWRPLDGAQ